MSTNRRFSIRPAIAALLLGSTAIAGATGGAAFASAEANDPEGHTEPVSRGITATGDHSSLADMVEAVGTSVVQIQVKPDARFQRMSGRAPSLDGRDELMRRFFGFPVPQQRAQPRGTLGSGFIIDSSGLNVTNNHVVEGADTVSVQISDGREFAGSVLGRDDKTDLAVVKIDSDGPFQAIDWGDSDHIRVGDSVFAVGSPFGLGNTVTSGIVSARSREIGAGPYDDFLQVDAAINSGNSGGPLFDASGRVIGVNTAIFSPSGGNVGIGFAIPAQLARDVAMEIVEHGGVSRGRIGVTLQDFTTGMAEAIGVRAAGGAVISSVEPNGPAARSGIRRGDVIREIAGRPVEDSGDVARAVADMDAGTKVPIEILREGRRLVLDLGIGGGTSRS